MCHFSISILYNLNKSASQHCTFYTCGRYICISFRSLSINGQQNELYLIFSPLFLFACQCLFMCLSSRCPLVFTIFGYCDPAFLIWNSFSGLCFFYLLQIYNIFNIYIKCSNFKIYWVYHNHLLIFNNFIIQLYVHSVSSIGRGL